MKFFTAVVLGITFMFGFVNRSGSADNVVEHTQSSSSKFVKKNFDTFMMPGNICIINIVNTDGAARSFNSYAHECLNKKRSWFKISIEEDAFKYK
tara:strand:+ start:275 stop:559 length:285 start_codon:yes stop_codon:yes gene_type:complete